MRSADAVARAALRVTLVAAVVVASFGTAFAGGPLYLVPSGGTLQPARWEGTVHVYTDQGTLGALSNARANQLVQNALTQWSSVRRRVFVRGSPARCPFDVTGANAGQVIGVSNGGGIQVIYDSDGSVIDDFIGAGPGVLGIATPEYLAAKVRPRSSRAG